MGTAVEQRAATLELQLAASQPHPRKQQLHALDDQLEDVYRSLQPTPPDYQARKAAVSFVNCLARDKLSVGDIRKELGFCHAVAFGSFTMDMFTPTSDLDISLNTVCGMETPTRNQKVKLLRKLTKVLYSLQTSGSVRQIQPVLKAKVPVVKFIHSNTGLECDVSVENREGIIKSEFLHIFSSIDARFRKLCFLLKAWANAQQINSSKDNTLNSLSIILLVAFHLQTRVPAILPPFSVVLKGLESAMTSQALSVVESKVIVYKDFGRKNKESVAQLFNSFLTQVVAVKDLWAEGLCASAYEGTWTLSTQPSCIFVEDFTSFSQNAARSVNCVGFDAIYNCCNEALVKLQGYLSGTHEAQYLKSFLFTPLPMKPKILSTKRKRPLLQDIQVDSGNNPHQPFHHNGYLEENRPVSWGPLPQSSEKRPRHMMAGMDYLTQSAMSLTGGYFPPLDAQMLGIHTGVGGEHSAKRIRLQQSTFIGRAFPLQNYQRPWPSNFAFAHHMYPGVRVKDDLLWPDLTHPEVSHGHSDARRNMHWLAEKKLHPPYPGGEHGTMPTFTDYPHQLYTESANVLYQNMCSNHLPPSGLGFRAN